MSFKTGVDIMMKSFNFQAEQFMKAHQKLSEFGFSNDKIKDALVACDMDLQKAVDKLI